MGRFRLLTIHSDICLDDRTFLIFCLVGFCCFFGLPSFYYEHTETLERVIQGGNRHTPAPGVWSSVRWGPLQTHLTSVGSPVLSRIFGTTFRCLFQPACFLLLWFYQRSAVLTCWYLFWQCFQYSLSIKVVLKKKVNFSWKGQNFDPNDLESCMPVPTVKAINTQHQEFLFRCLLQIIVPEVCVSKAETLHVV